MTRTFGSIPFIPLAAFALTTIFAPSWLSAQPQLLTPSAGSPIAVGNRPTGVATGDFNGDGKMDIAVADTSDSRVTVLLGDNAGGFTEAAGSPFFGGANPQVVIARDFNHDGKLDIASLNIGSYTISVLLGDGHGGFTLAPNPAAVSSPGGYMATGEFNGDNYPDLVVTDYGGANVLVFLGDGSGGFTAAPGSPISLGFGLEPTGVVTGDFNKDGKQDIAVAQSYDGHIAILTGDGTGAFTVQGIRPAGAQFPGTAGIGALAVGSFYNNGDLDLLVAGTNSNQVALLKGDGAADFSYQRQMTAYQRPLGIAVGDFDADGNQDVAAIAGNTSYLDIFPGNGAGNFNTATGPAYQTGTGPDGIATADFNNDGRPDIVVANNLDNTITVFLTNGPQLPPAPPSP
ncbi:MAG TPA: VCBS repeat-containing protein, partial [Bryobacteraceae bacterium]|nr:VCBS repeat-containing protein [Bryobacteraceae bacterium]